ncbi:MAG: hypothetical protein Q7O66_11460 [Dehalococcoidia bacterium]|nr:hypothetical protein [Dehalococcoidia bacterium]
MNSASVDHTLDFTKSYAALTISQNEPQSLTHTGLTGNGCFVGSALLWIPFFLIAHALALAG